MYIQLFFEGLLFIIVVIIGVKIIKSYFGKEDRNKQLRKKQKSLEKQKLRSKDLTEEVQITKELNKIIKEIKKEEQKLNKLEGEN